MGRLLQLSIIGIIFRLGMWTMGLLQPCSGLAMDFGEIIFTPKKVFATWHKTCLLTLCFRKRHNLIDTIGSCQCKIPSMPMNKLRYWDRSTLLIYRYTWILLVCKVLYFLSYKLKSIISMLCMYVTRIELSTDKLFNMYV